MTDSSMDLRNSLSKKKCTQAKGSSAGGSVVTIGGSSGAYRNGGLQQPAFHSSLKKGQISGGRTAATTATMQTTSSKYKKNCKHKKQASKDESSCMLFKSQVSSQLVMDKDLSPQLRIQGDET